MGVRVTNQKCMLEARWIWPEVGGKPLLFVVVVILIIIRENKTIMFKGYLPRENESIRSQSYDP